MINQVIECTSNIGMDEQTKNVTPLEKKALDMCANKIQMSLCFLGNPVRSFCDYQYEL